MLINRVASTDHSWHKEWTAPRVSPHFDLTLDDNALLRAINQLNFIQMKREQPLCSPNCKSNHGLIVMVCRAIRITLDLLQNNANLRNRDGLPSRKDILLWNRKTYNTKAIDQRKTFRIVSYSKLTFQYNKILLYFCVDLLKQPFPTSLRIAYFA